MTPAIITKSNHSRLTCPVGELTQISEKQLERKIDRQPPIQRSSNQANEERPDTRH